MFSQKISSLVFLFFAAGLISCASTPTVVQMFPPSADPAYEIERTQDMITEARDRQIDVLSPTNFNKAQSSLDKALKKFKDGKASGEVLEEVSMARGWLKDALSKSQIANVQMKDLLDARRGALNAGANEIFPKDWSRTGKELESVTKEIESGNLSPAAHKGPDIVEQYRDLERDAVGKTYLSRADDNIKMAEKLNAAKIAPKTYGAATMQYDNALRVIAADPRNTPAIRSAAANANRESLHLIDVTNQVKAGNSEDLILKTEQQQKAIAGLRQENRSVERQMTDMERQHAELEQSQRLINQAAAIRSQFKPNEAEVFTENGRVMVRMKALQFPANQATLGTKNQALLKKVNEALADSGPAKVIVEGHTDSTGNANRNLTLSEQRAKSVQDYLVANGAVTLDNVESVGMGSAKPIGDNKTSRGRAQNRRIDIIVEPLAR